jgi:hypothetical protein
MDNQTNEKLISAFWLLKDKLIDINTFNSIIDKLKNTIDKVNSITENQYNYIIRLKEEGKIPKEQSLDLTKQEAQQVIHHALNSLPNKPVTLLATGDQQSITGQAGLGDTIDLYKDKTEDY